MAANETEALADVRTAWDDHVRVVTKCLDKIAKLQGQPASDDNTAAIEDWVSKIVESTKSMSDALDAGLPTGGDTGGGDVPPPADGGGDSAPADGGDTPAA